MRDIKFRGKRKMDGKWIHGYLIGNDVIVGDIIEFNDEYFNTEFWWKVDPETVGQYTGLKDRRGREIYEGDIVSTDLSKSFNIVVFRNGAFMFQCNDSENDYFDYMLPTDKENDRWNYGEVIGNIHDNPEFVDKLIPHSSV